MDDTLAIVKACEKLNAPVFLMTNKDSINRIGIEYWASFLTKVKEKAKTNVYIHLDHCTDIDLIKKAIKSGYDSVMYDGSQLSLNENIKNTKKVSKLKEKYSFLLEGEIGSVRYDGVSEDVYKGQLTSSKEALEFVNKTNVDLLAIAIGTVHKLKNGKAKINYKLLEEIQNNIKVPLVLHGFSGVKEEDIKKLRNTNVQKVNIGTYLRRAYGNKMCQSVILNKKSFDRYELTNQSLKEVYNKTIIKLKELGWCK